MKRYSIANLSTGQFWDGEAKNIDVVYAKVRIGIYDITSVRIDGGTPIIKAWDRVSLKMDEWNAPTRPSAVTVIAWVAFWLVVLAACAALIYILGAL